MNEESLYESEVSFVASHKNGKLLLLLVPFLFLLLLFGCNGDPRLDTLNPAGTVEKNN